MKRLRATALLLLILVVLAGAVWVMRARHGSARPLSAVLTSTPTLPHAPEGVRIRVQVLNTTKVRGLARRATHLLRDQGFDVVEIGTTGPRRDTTLVLDRSGHPDWAKTVAAVMTPARSEARPDTSRYVDVTVLVGSSWRPPAEPLDP